MARWRNDIEAQREQLEADLGSLGNARVILRLVGERVDVAARSGQAGMWAPALEDLARAERLITQVQGRMARAEVSPARAGNG